ncbi:MAG TPA: efflux RND transporter periplasmic adaptor subunit [Nevskiaceae bacterium]|nr:efflux RND transporter periplasmic adaptor subunit [Nevskiaceae bacterium]
MLRLAVPALLVALFAACSGNEPPTAAPRPVVVEHPQSLAQGTADVFAGSVKARVESSLSFRVPGKILERKVDLGARVAKGTVLAVLDPQDAKLNLEAARAAVKAAEADLWLAKQEEKRYRDLKQRGFIGQSAVDLRVNTTKLSAAKLEQAKSQFDLAQNQSRYTTLTADSDGVITAIFAEVGNVVSAGQPIATFAADGEREIAIQIPEGRADAIAKAPQIGVQLYTNPHRIYAGKVRDVSPQADPATRTHTAHITIVDADAGVQLGATATVMAGTPGGENTFRLPSTAVGGPNPQQTGVWRVASDGNGGMTAQLVKVKVVQVLDAAVIVQGPLSSKDRLITAGVHRLVPGMAVQPIDRNAKAAL